MQHIFLIAKIIFLKSEMGCSMKILLNMFINSLKGKY